MTTRSGSRVDADAGAVLVWAALMIVVLVGVGALVIDVGAILVERRELQNGADAAALAVAQDCADGSCDGATARAKEYADLNAEDGTSAIASGTPCGLGPGLPACIDPAPSGASGALGWVRVGTRTETADGGSEISFVLAPLLSALTGKTVTASAVAAFGSAGGAGTLPFTFSECEFQSLLKPGETVPTVLATVYSKSGGGGGPNSEPLVPGCEPRSSSGGTVEGGFGWLSVSGGTCEVMIEVGEALTAPGNPGNDNLLSKSPCSLDLIRNTVLTVPLFSSVSGTGANAVYTISGFAAFEITGYRLSGSHWPNGFQCPQPPGGTGGTGNLRCFQGYFRPLVLGDGDFGGSVDFGVRVIKMIE